MLHIKSAQLQEQAYTCSANWWDETAPGNQRICGKPITANEVKHLNGYDGPLCLECEAQMGENCQECQERWDNELMEDVVDGNKKYRLCPTCAEGLRTGIRQDRQPSPPGIGQMEDDLDYNYPPISVR